MQALAYSGHSISEEEQMKKAYWVSIYHEILDQEKVDAYAALAGPALIANGAKVLARGMPSATFEKGQMQRTVILEFASVDAAKAAYNSPEYAEAIAAMDGGAIREVRIIEGE